MKGDATSPVEVAAPLRMALLLLLAAPWLNPVVFGPSSAALPLLMSWLFLLLGALMRPKADACLFASAWALAAAVSALMALAQYMGSAHFLTPFVHVPANGDVYANLRQRNQYATLTSIGIAAVIWLGNSGISSAKAYVLVALLALGNAASASRTGGLQLILIALTVLLWPMANKKLCIRLVFTAGVVYVVGVFLLPFIASSVFKVQGTSAFLRLAEGRACGSRGVLWDNVIELIKLKPWQGWGPGELDYAHYAHLYSGERFCDILDNAHNLPLHIAVEFGLPAALVMCVLLTWLVAKGKPWREAEPDRQLAWLVLAVIGLHSLLEYPLWYGPFQIASVLSFTLLLRKTNGQKPANSPRRTLGRLIAILFAAGATYAIWDYYRVSQLYVAVEARDVAYQSNTLQKAQASWLFRSQVDFAELVTTPLTLANADHVNVLATQLLHFSPEPKVIEKVIESSVILQRDSDVLWHLARYRTAFPEDYQAWSAAISKPP